LFSTPPGGDAVTLDYEPGTKSGISTTLIEYAFRRKRVHARHRPCTGFGALDLVDTIGAGSPWYAARWTLRTGECAFTAATDDGETR